MLKNWIYINFEYNQSPCGLDTRSYRFEILLGRIVTLAKELTTSIFSSFLNFLAQRNWFGWAKCFSYEIFQIFLHNVLSQINYAKWELLYFLRICLNIVHDKIIWLDINILSCTIESDSIIVHDRIIWLYINIVSCSIKLHYVEPTLSCTLCPKQNIRSKYISATKTHTTSHIPCSSHNRKTFYQHYCQSK